jgi:hypothetical protein
MTEREWLKKSDDVVGMLFQIEDMGLSNDRKLLLTGCAYCHQLRQITITASKALEWVQQRAEQETGHYQLDDEEDFRDLNEGEGDAIWPGVMPVNALIEAFNGGSSWNRRMSLRDGIVHVSNSVLRDIEGYWTYSGEAARIRKPLASVLKSELAIQHELIRDIFGNPFRPVTLDPRWLTSTVIDLARTIYEERVWERMPILADALMDAGCDSEEVIKHCQGPGPHVRGCWVVDLLTGRE